MANTFSVVYRSGGTISCRWTRILEVYATRDEAEKVAESIEKGGRKALIMRTSLLDSSGLPIGWDSDAVNFDRDYVEVTRFHTQHEVL